MKMNKNKRGQVAIFVIIALVLVVMIAGIIGLTNYLKIRGVIENPQEYIRSCIEGALKEAEQGVLETNGYFEENLTNFILYNGGIVPYLCKASEFHIPCTPQEPNFARKIATKVEKYVKPRANVCFANLLKQYEKQGYEVSENESEIEISYESDSIIAIINKEIVLTKGESTIIYKKFEGKIKSPVYQLADTAEKITNFESTLCQFNYINWMRIYPETKISLFRASDQTKVYTITDRASEKEIKIAIKTCLIPAGL